MCWVAGSGRCLSPCRGEDTSELIVVMLLSDALSTHGGVSWQPFLSRVRPWCVIALYVVGFLGLPNSFLELSELPDMTPCSRSLCFMTHPVKRDILYPEPGSVSHHLLPVLEEMVQPSHILHAACSVIDPCVASLSPAILLFHADESSAL